MDNIVKSLKNGTYSLGRHTEERAFECQINISKVVKELSLVKPSISQNPTGKVLIFRKKMEDGREIRMIAGHNAYNPSEAFIVSLYRTDEGDDSIGQRSYKFQNRKSYNREMTYEFG